MTFQNSDDWDEDRVEPSGETIYFRYDSDGRPIASCDIAEMSGGARPNTTQENINEWAKTRTAKSMAASYSTPVKVLGFSNSSLVGKALVVDFEFETRDGSETLHEFLRQTNILHGGQVYVVVAHCAAPKPLAPAVPSEIRAFMRSLSLEGS